MTGPRTVLYAFTYDGPDQSAAYMAAMARGRWAAVTVASVAFTGLGRARRTGGRSAAFLDRAGMLIERGSRSAGGST